MISYGALAIFEIARGYCSRTRMVNVADDVIFVQAQLKRCGLGVYKNMTDNQNVSYNVLLTKVQVRPAAEFGSHLWSDAPIYQPEKIIMTQQAIWFSGLPIFSLDETNLCLF